MKQTKLVPLPIAGNIQTIVGRGKSMHITIKSNLLIDCEQSLIFLLVGRASARSSNSKAAKRARGTRAVYLLINIRFFFLVTCILKFKSLITSKF